jgi:thiamine biosynthesis lipoprotein
MRIKFNLNVLIIICSVLGITGIFLINNMNPLRTETRDGVALDTVIRMTASAVKPRAEIRGILDGAFSLMADAEKKFSMHDPGSEVSAISAASGEEPVKVSGETFAVLTSALESAQLTDGAFDPTMGALSLLWQKNLGEGRVPRDDEIKSALKRVGYNRLKLSAPDTVFLKDEGTIDLGGVAKGHVSAMVRDFMRREGITSALIDLGGNVVAIGGRPEKGKGELQPWSIGVQHPSKPRGTPICVIRIYDGSVVTAGSYERFWDVGGRRYAHIFDPETGRPVEGELKSVTIVSGDPALGDALSTAFMVMGKERSLELLQIIPECDAIFVSEDGNGGYGISATSGLRDTLSPVPGGEPIVFHDVQ